MTLSEITVTLSDCAADHRAWDGSERMAVALLAPLGIDTEFQRFEGFDAPEGWDVSILAEARTGQRAALLVPPSPMARGVLRHRFSADGPGLGNQAYRPEGTPLSQAAAALAEEAQRLAAEAGHGRTGINAIVQDASARFSYGSVPYDERFYYGRDAVPVVACAVGNCIDINTYLVAALRAAGYDTAYLTCYFFDDAPDRIASGMHCWVRTRDGAGVQDWDIAHFKKVGREDVSEALNPVPGQRFALAHGRDHVYRWQGLEITVPTPSVPVWITPDGQAHWPEPPDVKLAEIGAAETSDAPRTPEPA